MSQDVHRGVALGGRYDGKTLEGLSPLQVSWTRPSLVPVGGNISAASAEIETAVYMWIGLSGREFWWPQGPLPLAAEVLERLLGGYRLQPGYGPDGDSPGMDPQLLVAPRTDLVDCMLVFEASPDGRPEGTVTIRSPSFAASGRIFKWLQGQIAVAHRKLRR
jgi:hypothetical protein